MNLLYRLGFYLVGFSIGLVFLTVILKGKKTSCNYGPNDRVISNLSKKSWKHQNRFYQWLLERKAYFDNRREL